MFMPMCALVPSPCFCLYEVDGGCCLWRLFGLGLGCIFNRYFPHINNKQSYGYGNNTLFLILNYCLDNIQGVFIDSSLGVFGGVNNLVDE